MNLVAVGCATLAVLLVLRPTARLPATHHPRAARVAPVLVPVLAAPLLLLVPRFGALLVVLAGAGLGGIALWRRRRRRRAAARVSAEVLETCELLAGELSAGRPSGVALARAAEAWPPLAPVAESFRVGADVPSAMRTLAHRLEGAADLHVLAAAWQVAHRTGQGLATAIDRVTASLRAEAATRRVVEGELASARATARLVAGLPVLALAMGSGAGGDPWGFLLGHPAGLACLAGGLALGFAGLWWIEAIAAGVEA